MQKAIWTLKEIIFKVKSYMNLNSQIKIEMKIYLYFKDYLGFNLKYDSEKQERCIGMIQDILRPVVSLFMTTHRESTKSKLHEVSMDSRGWLSRKIESVRDCNPAFIFFIIQLCYTLPPREFSPAHHLTLGSAVTIILANGMKVNVTQQRLTVTSHQGLLLPRTVGPFQNWLHMCDQCFKRRRKESRSNQKKYLK